MYSRFQERSDWIEEMACRRILRAPKGWQTYDADAAACSDGPSIELLTQIGLLYSRFAVSAFGKNSGVTANLEMSATGPAYAGEMSRRIDSELATRWGVDEWEKQVRLSGWKLELTGEIVQDSFKRHPHSRRNELVRRDYEVLDAELWSCVSLISITGVGPVAKNPVSVPKPVWDRGSGTLSFDGEVIRTVKPGAINVRRVLDAFQEQDWPPRTDDPFPGQYSSERVKETCDSLRTKLKRIDFRLDGLGLGYRWSVLPVN